MEEEVLGKAYDSRLMRRLLAYTRPYSGTIAISLIFLLASSVVQILGPLLTKLTVDRYLVPASHPVATPIDRYLSSDPWTGIAQLSGIYLLSI